MPIDGGGFFTRLHNFKQDRDDNIRILASRMDDEFDNVAEAINTPVQVSKISYNGEELSTTLDDITSSIADLEGKFPLYTLEGKKDAEGNMIDQLNEILSVISNNPHPTVKPNSSFLLVIPAGVSIVSVLFNKITEIDWNNSEFVIKLDFTNPTMAFRNLFLFNACRFNWTRLRMRYEPRLESVGTVLSYNTANMIGGILYSTVDLNIAPEDTPTAWNISGMDTYGLFDTYGVVDWQYVTDNSHRSYPYPIIKPDPVNNPTVWRIQLPVKTITLTGIVSKSPLSFTTSGDNLSDGDLVTFDNASTGLQIGGVSVINGKTFRVRIGGTDDVDDGSTYIQLIDSVIANPINASTATDYTGGGTATSKPLSPNIAVGQRMGLLCRKRGGNPFIFNNCANLNLRVETEGSGAAFVVGKGNTDPTIDIKAVGRGIIGTNADTILLQNTRGKLYLPKFRVEGSGDTFFAAPAANYVSRVLAGSGAAGVGFTANTLTVTAWTDPNTKDSLQTPPLIGDPFVYMTPDGVMSPTVNKVVSVVGTTITLSGNHPTGFDPNAGWRVWNANEEPDVEIGYADLQDSLCLGWTTQGKSVNIDRMRLSGCLQGIRVMNIGTTFPGRNSGQTGKVKWNSLDVSGCGYDIAPQRGGALVGSVRSTNGPPPAASAYDPIDWGKLTLTHIPLCAVYADGRDHLIRSWAASNMGFMRNDPRYALIPFTQYDIYARYANVDVVAHELPLPSFFEDTGGYVTFWQGSYLTNSGSLINNGVNVFAAKKVKAGHERRVTVFVNGVYQDPSKYTANGTKTLTFIVTPNTTGGQVSFTVTHVAC